MTKQAKWMLLSRATPAGRGSLFHYTVNTQLSGRWLHPYTRSLAVPGCACHVTPHNGCVLYRDDRPQHLCPRWPGGPSSRACQGGRSGLAPRVTTGLPASPPPADGGAAHIAPGASDAARLPNPAPAAFHEGTPTGPGPELPCRHLYRKAAPRLQTVKGEPRVRLARPPAPQPRTTHTALWWRACLAGPRPLPWRPSSRQA